MGRLFLEHLGGERLFSCVNCDTFLTNRSLLISTRFTGATGRAYLFDKVVNLKLSGTQDRIMLTGRHIVRDVHCKKCDTKLGWMYEFATDDSQKYKEGKVILERALVTESDGFSVDQPMIGPAATEQHPFHHHHRQLQQAAHQQQQQQGLPFRGGVGGGGGASASSSMNSSNSSSLGSVGGVDGAGGGGAAAAAAVNNNNNNNLIGFNNAGSLNPILNPIVMIGGNNRRRSHQQQQQRRESGAGGRDRDREDDDAIGFAVAEVGRHLIQQAAAAQQQQQFLQQQQPP